MNQVVVLGRAGRALAVIASMAVIGVCANADIFKKKGGAVKSPIVETVRVSTEGLIPAGLKPVDPPPQQAAAPADGSESPESSTPVSDVASSYTLGPGDTLSFQSFDDPTLTRDGVLVLMDGTISLPLIPDVQVEGKTRAEAENEVREAYKAVFKDPQLALNIRTATSKYYYVMGDVNRAAKYPYEGRTTVLEAVNNAGGLRITQRSGGESYAATTGTLSKAFLIRTTDGKREVTELDLRGLTRPGAHPSDTPVLPNDVVYIPENVNLVYILGEVRQPSVFQLSEGQTLLQVLTQAGGFEESVAKLRGVVVIRPVDDTHSDVIVVDLRQSLKAGVDLPIFPGDIVYIPRKDLLRAQEFVSRLTGTISPILSLYTQFFDAYYAPERNRLLVDAGENGNDIIDTLQAIRSFGGNFQSALPNLPNLNP
ncbi:MAG TPA: polysaccharide biosynthesis/export family protein [Candidatus Hydrogenedentes bacterium]|nr:polysaccharide biosynthesis/export family protein [Candidatus Hydrogenedentota bacterium]HRK33817.1 polysaccharide biosynthesis/export family protein [Candidatus Hydrogenedentota bacterium]